MFDSSSISIHSHKGTQSINLDSGVPDPVQLEDDSTTIDILMDSIALPSECVHTF